LRKIPKATAQMIEVPNMAPFRVASITSPEPMYSAAQTIDGPTSPKIAKPFGGGDILFDIDYSRSIFWIRFFYQT